MTMRQPAQRFEPSRRLPQGTGEGRRSWTGWKVGVLTAIVAVATVSARPVTVPAPVPLPEAILEPAREAPPSIVGRVLQASAVQGQQPSEIEMVIRGDAGVQPRYAVPDFVALTPDAADAARTIAQVLWEDLNFEREFYMIPREESRRVAPATRPEQIRFDLWRELNADAVVFGTVQRKGNELLVQVRLYNVRSQQSVFAKEYAGGTGNVRLYAHTISDEIHEQQRSLQGVARTRLTFVSDRRRQALQGTVLNREASEVFVADYDGANEQQITITRDLNVTPTWSPDGRAVAYTSYRRHLPDIFISYIYEGRRQELTKGEGNNFMPAYSPDGRQIAFASNRRDNNFEIYVVNVDGSNLRRLTNNPGADIAPTWSPSGQQIAFTSDRSGRPQIYVMDIDGRNLERLTFESEAVRPTWAPAPYNEIAFAAQTGAGYDIKVINVATRETRQLTFGEGSNESPSYSPTGRHVAFTSTRAGNHHIFTIGRDSRGIRQVTREGGNRMANWSR
jgi:TolB protein